MKTESLLKKGTTNLLLLFLFLLFIVIVINLIGDSWLYSLILHNNNQNFSNNFFSPISFLFLFAFLVRDVFIPAILLYYILWLLNIRLKFNQLLYMAMIAEFVFVIQNVVELIYVYFNRFELSLIQIKNFASFSIYNCFKNTPNYLYYVATTTNLWELAYMVFFAYLLKIKLNSPFLGAFRLVLIGYGIPLIVWMIYVTFIQILQA